MCVADSEITLQTPIGTWTDVSGYILYTALENIYVAIEITKHSKSNSIVSGQYLVTAYQVFI